MRQRLVLGQHLQVLGESAGNGVTVEQGRGVTVTMIGQHFMNSGNAEGFEKDNPVGAAEERFLGILEDAVHERVNRTDADQVQFAGCLVTVPDSLNLGVNRRIDAEELLKLVNDQGNAFGAGKTRSTEVKISRKLRISPMTGRVPMRRISSRYS